MDLHGTIDFLGRAFAITQNKRGPTPFIVGAASRRDSTSNRRSGVPPRFLNYLTRLKAIAVTISRAIDGSQVTIAGFRLNTWPEFAIISLARK